MSKLKMTMTVDVEDVGDTAQTTVMRKVSQSGTYLIQQEKQTLLLATIENIGMMITVIKPGFLERINFLAHQPTTFSV